MKNITNYMMMCALLIAMCACGSTGSGSHELLEEYATPFEQVAKTAGVDKKKTFEGMAEKSVDNFRKIKGKEVPVQIDAEPELYNVVGALISGNDSRAAMGKIDFVLRITAKKSMEITEDMMNQRIYVVAYMTDDTYRCILPINPWQEGQTMFTKQFVPGELIEGEQACFGKGYTVEIDCSGTYLPIEYSKLKNLRVIDQAKYEALRAKPLGSKFSE